MVLHEKIEKQITTGDDALTHMHMKNDQITI
jgi:hypothetical protein